jgi:hypothetical protein
MIRARRLRGGVRPRGPRRCPDAKTTTTRAGVIAGLTAWAGLAAVAPIAVADPTRLITQPARWRADPEQATALAQRFAATGHFGALRTVTAAEAYVAERPGVALFVTRATAVLSDPPAQAARVTRAALDELRASSRRAALTGGAAQERDWQERVEADARQVTATLTWSDTASHTVDTARIVVASDGTRIVAVTGECLAGEAADATLVAACRTALATLDPGVAASSRTAPALAPEALATAPDTAPNTAPDTMAVPASASAPPREPARLDDGSKIVMPPTAIPLDRPDADRRPVFVGAGVIVLALVFWWNRRQRDLFEQEDRGERSLPRRPRRRTDEDADDLHAAARGEDPAPAKPGKRGAPAKPGSQAKPDRQDK